MQAAIEKATGERLYASLFADFQDRFVGHSKIGDEHRFACPGCDAGTHAKGGGSDRIDPEGVVTHKAVVGHFAHYPGAECAYAKAWAEESEEHRAMKQFVARVINSCGGWAAAVEVPGKGWKADVLAEQRFDMSLAMGRQHVRNREVVFEIQHTPETSSETRDRTQRYLDAGCEVVWLFDHDSARQVGRDPAVVAKRVDAGSYVVTKGIWSPAGGSPEVDLEEFIRAVLDRRIGLEEVPAQGKSVGRRAWVWKTDTRALQRIRRNAQLSAARASAVEEVTAALRREGVRATVVRRNDPNAAFATVLGTMAGTIAVHPRPSHSTSALALLRTCSAVIIASEEERVQLVRNGLDSGVIFDVTEFESIVGARFRPAPSTQPPSAEGRLVDTPPAPEPSAALPAPPASPLPTETTRSGRRRFRWLRLRRRG